jgi:hypothetical protein
MHLKLMSSLIFFKYTVSLNEKKQKNRPNVTIQKWLINKSICWNEFPPFFSKKKYVCLKKWKDVIDGPRKLQIRGVCRR